MHCRHILRAEWFERNSKWCCYRRDITYSLNTWNPTGRNVHSERVVLSVQKQQIYFSVFTIGPVHPPLWAYDFITWEIKKCKLCSISHRLTVRHTWCVIQDRSQFWNHYMLTVICCNTVAFIFCNFFPNFPRHTGGTQRNWSLFFVTCSKLQQAVIVHVLFSWRREFFMLFTLLLPLKDHSVLLLFACARLDGYCCQTKGRHGLQDQIVFFHPTVGKSTIVGATEQRAAEACSAIKAATI